MANELMPLLSLSQAKALVAHLEAQQISAANEIIESAGIAAASEDSMFGKVGELTRELHDTLLSFQNDTRLLDMAGQDIPDAKDRLNYVIEMTDAAANKTMDAVDTCLPIADKLIEDLEAVIPNWQGLMRRELALGEFKILCHQVDDMINESTSRALTLRSSLTDILMAQDFQDLTGQMIRRVILLVQEIESKLVGILTVCHAGSAGLKLNTNKSDVKRDIEAEGPIINAEERDDVVNGQDDVDDLLSSLGF
ncbi:protein phosphatase CheZ [Psychromonas antarctica]|jgi:chemotaxis protein CheZ|uniref:protein phosphatase CheZ n=1 Tax=Psychromonas antarctica TaxID=67573 RepID=UPI001EE87650|nr:protein phosphatase CheZ [Psychromonas antarctica]MCG6199826.1 protein phosphatase CheZ [Psychromonas antarctica]